MMALVFTPNSSRRRLCRETTAQSVYHRAGFEGFPQKEIKELLNNSLTAGKGSHPVSHCVKHNLQTDGAARSCYNHGSIGFLRQSLPTHQFQPNNKSNLKYLHAYTVTIPFCPWAPAVVDRSSETSPAELFNYVRYLRYNTLSPRRLPSRD